MSAVAFDVRGTKECLAMLDRFAGRELVNRMRRAVRAGAKPFQSAVKAAAAAEPTGNLPASFTKVPAAKVSTRGGVAGRDIIARIRPKSPLFNVFEPGAAAHDISGDLLVGPAGTGGWTATGRKRSQAMGARGRVRHPGMKARPILAIAFAASAAAAQAEVARVLFEPAR